MNVHIFTKDTLDGRIRFSRVYDDDAFFALVDRMGGYLPWGWKAVHIDEDDYLHPDDCPRMKIISSIPIAVSTMGIELDPEPFLLRECRLTDEQYWFEKLCLLGNRLQVTCPATADMQLDELQELYGRLRDKQRAMPGRPSQASASSPAEYCVFLHPELRKYLVQSVIRLDPRRASSLHAEGWIPMWESLGSKKLAHALVRCSYPEYEPFEPVKKPITFQQACAFVNRHHRHHVSPQGHKFSVAVTDGRELIGVLIAGHPVSRHRDDGRTLEITRLCVKEAYANLCSMLYSAAARIGREMGYSALITYTLQDEPGGSLRASGFELSGTGAGGSWSSERRKRRDKHPTGPKKIWKRELARA